MNAEQVKIVCDGSPVTTTLPMYPDELRFVDDDIREAFKGCAYPPGLPTQTCANCKKALTACVVTWPSTSSGCARVGPNVPVEPGTTARGNT